MPFSELRQEALRLAQEAKRLASESAGLARQIDHGSSTPDDEAELHALSDQTAAASLRFDAFVASALQTRRAEWLELVSAVTSALVALDAAASVRKEASWLLPDWQLASQGTAQAGFAAAFIAGLELVDRNYRLLLKAGGLPRGFPRLPRG
jgi:hypothetical protein